MRTEDAVTQANGIWVTFTAVLLLYALLGTALVITLRAMSRRWRDTDAQDSDVPYGPSDAQPEATGEQSRRGRGRADGRRRHLRGVRRC